MPWSSFAPPSMRVALQVWVLLPTLARTVAVLFLILGLPLRRRKARATPIAASVICAAAAHRVAAYTYSLGR